MALGGDLDVRSREKNDNKTTARSPRGRVTRRITAAKRWTGSQAIWSGSAPSTRSAPSGRDDDAAELDLIALHCCRVSAWRRQHAGSSDPYGSPARGPEPHPRREPIR